MVKLNQSQFLSNIQSKTIISNNSSFVMYKDDQIIEEKQSLFPKFGYIIYFFYLKFIF